MTRFAVAAVALREPLSGLTVAVPLAIDGQSNDRATRGLGPFEEPSGDTPVVGRIELIPNGCAGGFRDVFDRGCGDGRENLKMFLRSERPGPRLVLRRDEMPFG